MFATERRSYAGHQRPGLYRSMSNKAIAGVCGGLGEHFGVSIKWLRVSMVILTIMTFPVMPIIYGIFILALPKAQGLGPEWVMGRRRHGFVPPIPRYTSDITPEQLNREFDTIEARIRSLEDFVTSREYVLKRKFESL